MIVAPTAPRAACARPWQSYSAPPSSTRPLRASRSWSRCRSTEASPPRTLARRPPSPFSRPCACRRAGRRAGPPGSASSSTQRILPERTSCASHDTLTSLSRPEKPPMPATFASCVEDRRGRVRLARHRDRAAAVRLDVGEDAGRHAAADRRAERPALRRRLDSAPPAKPAAAAPGSLPAAGRRRDAEQLAGRPARRAAGGPPAPPRRRRAPSRRAGPPPPARWPAPPRRPDARRLDADAGPPAGNVPLVAWPSVSNAHTAGAASSAASTAPSGDHAHARELNATSASTASAPTTISTGGSHVSCPG